MKKWGSYTVQSPSELYHHASLPIGGHRKLMPNINTYILSFVR